MLKKLMHFKLGKRIRVGYVLAIVLAVFMTTITLIFTLVVENRYHHITTYYAFPQGDIGFTMAILANTKGYTETVIGYDEPTSIERAIQSRTATLSSLEGCMNNIRASIVTDVGEEHLRKIEKTVQAYLTVDEKLFQLGISGDPEKIALAQSLTETELEPAYVNALKELEYLMDANISLSESETDNINVITTILVIGLIIIAVIASAAILNIGRKIASNLSDPMNELIERLNKFSEGDITSEFSKYEYPDELGEMITVIHNTLNTLSDIINDTGHLLGEMSEGHFNIKTSCEKSYAGDFNKLLMGMRQMNRNMDKTLREVKESSAAVNIGSTNLAEASQSLAEGATDQAASVQEILATISDMTSGLTTTVSEISKSYKQAEDCAIKANTSKEQMSLLIESMTKMQETSKEISKIIEDIEDIASQTNLLSLNASIEAARAGEAGRGFAVVADQIGKLAADSAKSAVNTRTLIEGSILEIEASNKAVENTAEVLDTVIRSIENITKLSSNVKANADDQLNAMTQVEEGIARIAEIVQSNSAAAEEASATSEELSAQAQSMDELVARFQLRE